MKLNSPILNTLFYEQYRASHISSMLCLPYTTESSRVYEYMSNLAGLLKRTQYAYTVLRYLL